MLSTTVARTSHYRCVVAYADCLDSAGGETHGEQSGSKQGQILLLLRTPGSSSLPLIFQMV
jgi:hypothetical protein